MADTTSHALTHTHRQPQSLARRARWSVRGRGGMIATATLAAAAVGVTVGFFTTEPIYQSVAQITYRTDAPTLAARTAAAERLTLMAQVDAPHIDARVIGQAQQVIELRAYDPHADVAHAAVRAILNDYLDKHVTSVGALARLETRRSELLAQRAALADEVQAAARMQSAQAGMAQRVAMLRSAMNQIEIARVVAASSAVSTTRTAPAWVRLVDDAPPQSTTGTALANQAAIARPVNAPRGQGRTSPAMPIHPEERVLAGYSEGGAPEDPLPAAMVRVDLMADHTRLAALAREAEHDLAELTERMQQADEAQRRLGAVSHMLDSLERVDVTATEATLATTPAIDPRPRAAMTGGAIAAVLGMFGALAVCFTDRRVRSGELASDLAGRAPLIGTVPRLESDAYDAQGAAAAARHVHEIRALLQASMFNADAGALAVTSPSRGSGKTSITVGLGVSFALTGSRVLVIDCDFTGGGMRHRAKQMQADAPTSPRRAASSRSSSRVRLTSEGLDETLVGLGYVPRAELDDALTLSDAKDFGIIGCLNGKPIEACAMPTRIDGLSILSAATAQAEDVDRLSPGAIRKLIDEARQSYDIVLIDTGPTPGSVEGMLASAAADAVLLNVCYGEDREELDRSITRLRMIGAKVAGVVFNRDPQAVDDQPRDMRENEPRRRNRAAVSAPSLGSGLLAVAIETNADFPDVSGDEDAVDGRKRATGGLT